MLPTLQNKNIAYFGTAGFGGSADYYEQLWQRVAAQLPESNRLLGHFFCQGKMPIGTRERYVHLLTAHPEDAKLRMSVENFDRALSHPDEADLSAAKAWAVQMRALAGKQSAGEPH